MGHSIIISSHSDKFIKDKVANILKFIEIDRKNITDILAIKAEKKQSIGIESIKELKEWAKVKPFSAKAKVAIIKDAELLTEEAQNSTLKILEEPNESLCLILTCSNYRSLLPTVISRCEIFSDFTQEKRSEIEFLSLNAAEKLEYIRKIVENKKKTKNWDEIREFLINLVYFYRENILKNVKIKESSFNIKLIQETDRMLKANVLPKLALENMAINLR